MCGSYFKGHRSSRLTLITHQALAKIMRPAGKRAKIGKSSRVLTTLQPTFLAQFVEVLHVDTPELFQEDRVPHQLLISVTSYRESFME